MRAACLSLILLFSGCFSGLGDPCETTEDCRKVDRGYCALTGICVASCRSDGERCSDDGVCAMTGGRLVCLPPCDADEDCRPSDACVAVEGASACILSDPLAEP